MEKLDYKKAEKQFYQPKKIELIDVPSMKFITIDGSGAPSEDDFQAAIKVLFPVAYAISMSYKGDYEIPGFQPFVVAPLEGLWDSQDADYLGDKSELIWKIMLRMPDFVTEEVVEWAKQEVLRKKKLNASAVKFEALTDGLCIQAMHLGSFDDEPATFEAMEVFAAAKGLVPEHRGYHHREIYLSDFRKVAPEKLKTVLRLFVKRK